jgi:selenide,water dikinase
MRCTGCGGKVSGPILRRVLDRLDVPASDRVLLGLDAPDDAAIVRPQDGHPLVMTTDFFSAFLDDPYVVGRVALLNAASDVFAMGARPLAAMAIVTLPLGDARQQEQLLWELLSGGVHELQQMDATLVGGHTIEGPQLAIGYSMLAELSRTEACTKARLRPGLRLILTKPLGTGILLAAQMRARCRADWLPPLLETMLCSNREAAEIALRHDITAMTDVTGFGLAGHLLEMLHASDVAARVNLDAVPLLPGVAELVEAGIESTLAPSNRETTAEFSTAAEISTIAAQGESAQFSALFDPQTAGGLLIGVDPAHEVQLLDQLHAAGYPQAVCIGEVEAHTSQAARIHLV